MAITVVTSIQDDVTYYENLAYLRKGLQKEKIEFIGAVHNFNPEYNFDSNRVYDFVRSARSTVREGMAANLVDALPELQPQDHRIIREAFDCLFDYYSYKRYLDIVGKQRAESMKMLIFNNDQYVAHVYYNCTSFRNGPKDFRVEAALSCQRYTYFPKQQANVEDILEALQNLQVHADE